ncbi:hypothetical protein [Paraburkholderia dilworthii]|uniref:Uncharacterized protein n=1 Tax=Paraburkholderia dilworthii TaxID=948106 RepID=A0ABW9DCR4_9BURK
MKQYTGQLKTLGAGSSSVGRGDRYTYIEIGDHRIKNVGVSDALDGILQEALHNSTPISIWIVSYFGKKIIAGVSRADGTVFRAKMTGILMGSVVAAIACGFLYAGFAEHSPFHAMLGLAFGSWVLYFANVNRQLFSIPANDVL